jgi:hypothetical protein
MDREPANVPSTADRLGEPFPDPSQSGSPLKGQQPMPPGRKKLHSSNALGLIQAYSNDEESDSKKLDEHNTSSQPVPEHSGRPMGQPARAPDGNENEGGKSCKNARSPSIAEEGSAYCAYCLPPLERKGHQGTLEGDEQTSTADSPGKSFERPRPGAHQKGNTEEDGAAQKEGQATDGQGKLASFCKKCGLWIPAGRKACTGCSGWAKRRSLGTHVPGGGDSEAQQPPAEQGGWESEPDSEQAQAVCKRCQKCARSTVPGRRRARPQRGGLHQEGRKGGYQGESAGTLKGHVSGHPWKGRSCAWSTIPVWRGGKGCCFQEGERRRADPL